MKIYVINLYPSMYMNLQEFTTPEIDNSKTSYLNNSFISLRQVFKNYI